MRLGHINEIKRKTTPAAEKKRTGQRKLRIRSTDLTGGSRPRKTYTNDSSRRKKGNLDPALRWATNKNQGHCYYQKIDSHTNKSRLNPISTWQTKAELSTYRQERVVQKHTRIKLRFFFITMRFTYNHKGHCAPSLI
jgi:hypothetical protein